MRTCLYVKAFVLGCASVFISCSDNVRMEDMKDMEVPIPVEVSQISPEFQTTISPHLSSRTVLGADLKSTLWEEGDAIGMYMLLADQNLEQNYILNDVHNVHYFASKQSSNTVDFLPKSEKVYYPKREDTKVHFIAYYPYSENVKDFEYTINTSDQADRGKIDLLYTTNYKQKAHSKNSGTVDLTFDHVLCSIIIRVNIEYDTKMSYEIDPFAMNAELVGWSTQAVFNLKSGALTIDSEQNTIELQHNRIKGSEHPNYIEFRAILLPHQIHELGDSYVAFSYSDDRKSTYAWKMPPKIYEAQKQYIYLVTLNEKGVQSVEVSIKDWVVEEESVNAF